jgi:hypothetical protein
MEGMLSLRLKVNLEQVLEDLDWLSKHPNQGYGQITPEQAEKLISIGKSVKARQVGKEG